MTNHELVQYRSIAVRGCSYQLFNEDSTTLVPTKHFLLSYTVDAEIFVGD